MSLWVVRLGTVCGMACNRATGIDQCRPVLATEGEWIAMLLHSQESYYLTQTETSPRHSFGHTDRPGADGHDRRRQSGPRVARVRRAGTTVTRWICSDNMVRRVGGCAQARTHFESVRSCTKRSLCLTGRLLRVLGHGSSHVGMIWPRRALLRAGWRRNGGKVRYKYRAARVFLGTLRRNAKGLRLGTSIKFGLRTCTLRGRGARRG